MTDERAQADRPLVLITGAAGSIGSDLAAAISDAYTVVGLDLKCDGSDVRCYEADLSDPDALKRTLERVRAEHGRRVAAVVHLAAYFDFTGEDSPLYEKVNETGTRNLMRALQAFEVERFIYSGTMLVHRPTEPGNRIDETTPIEPKWAYPQSKARTEEIIRAERGAIPVTLLHLAGLYDDESAVPTLAHQIARIYERDLKSRLYPGEGEAGQSMIHREDMIEVFRRAIDRRDDQPDECVILAGEPEGVAYQDLQDEIGRLVHGVDEWETLAVPGPLAKAGAWAQEKAEPVVPDAIDQGEKPFIRPFMVEMAQDHYALNISRAEKLLDWRPRHDVRRTLPKIVEALKRDPIAWYKAHKMTPPDWLEAIAETTDEPERVHKRYEERRIAEHGRNRWAHLINAGLGLWLMTSPPSLDYGSQALVWSDVVSGAVITIFALLSTSARMERARWVVAGAGFWLLWAPLIFWAPTAQAYLNETLVGALVLGFSICTRPSPGVSPAAAETGPDVPPGWAFSPSSWMQRLPIIGLAVIGLLISRHLTAYQLGHIDGIWDPVFPGTRGEGLNGSEDITTSSVSEAWPIPDAGVGAVVYMMEIITGMMGTNRRWRTMPWLVTAFGLMIVPLGAVSIFFIIIQPVVIGTWCALCLLQAAAMLIQVPYSFDELVASGQFLVRRKKQGRPLLRIFFVGDTDEGDARERDGFRQPFPALLKEMALGGVNFPLPLLGCVAIGVWLMFTRLTLGADGAMANADHIIGALAITVSVTAFAETARAVRFLNLPLGAALILMPFLFPTSLLQSVLGVALGLGLIALSLPKGRIRQSYGSWDRFIV